MSNEIVSNLALLGASTYVTTVMAKLRSVIYVGYIRNQ